MRRGKTVVSARSFAQDLAEAGFVRFASMPHEPLALDPKRRIRTYGNRQESLLGARSCCRSFSASGMRGSVWFRAEATVFGSRLRAACEVWLQMAPQSFLVSTPSLAFEVCVQDGYA